jgi:hypothetical protein
LNDYLSQVSTAARKAVFGKDWATVDACAKEILKHDGQSAEGNFLAGLVEAGTGCRTLRCRHRTGESALPCAS